MDESVEHLLREPVKPGRRLGSNYLVGERLGRGAMGVVHEATTNDGKPMAVKFLRAELASDHKTVARFLQERQIFRKINHPNVVRVHDLVAEGDDLAIVMERVSGGDLKQRIENRSLTPRQSLVIAAGIAAGLSAIHGASVVHRDLKPANILLTDDLSPKISDFGISRLVTEAMTRTSATIGTPIYMAPEAADARGADAPADVYALGIMLFELLVGRPPFSQGGTFAVLRAHAMDVPPRVEGVPAPLAELIARMLAKEPAQRPTVGEVEQHLAAMVPHIGDDLVPTAVPPVGEPGMDVGSGELTGPPVGGERVSSDQVAAAGGLAAAAWVATDSSETVVSQPEADARSAWASPSVSTSGETVISQDPVISGDPVPGLGAAAVGGMAAAAAGAVPGGNDATIVTPGLAGPGSGQAGPGPVGGPGFGGLAGDASSSGGDGVPFVAGRAPDAARRTGGLGSLFPNRIPRRVIEVGAAIGSLAAVLVVALVMTSGGDDGNSTGIASGGVSTTVPAAPGLDPDGGEDDGQGPTEFTSNIDLGDDEDGGTPTTGGASTSTGGGPSSTTATTAGPSSTTTTASTTSTSTATTASTTTPTTQPTTSTTRPTTTTSTTITTTTSTTQPTATPIRIVSGPTINEVNATSFRFSYRTNDVCGTGSFSVSTLGGTSVGSFSGDNICFGPGHGGYPGLQSSANFRNFNLEPGTTYRVSITVRGTPSDGNRTAGSGSDSTSFQVTTAG